MALGAHEVDALHNYHQDNLRRFEMEDMKVAGSTSGSSASSFLDTSAQAGAAWARSGSEPERALPG